MKNFKLFLAVPLMLCACTGSNNKSDAYGNFEAIEIMVGAEVQGKLMALNIDEGQLADSNAIVGLIDTVPLYLKKAQLIAQKEISNARLSQLNAQIHVQEQQQKNTEQEQKRIEKLVATSAAPSKQRDDIANVSDVQKAQLEATGTQSLAIAGELKVLNIQIAQINDQIQRSVIRIPKKSMVLEKYLEQGEIVTPGKAMLKVADVSKLILRAFVSGNQLSAIKIGQKTDVVIDAPNNKIIVLEGNIIWISPQAEFTPKIIQTREERVNLVYSIKIEVVNDGSLKIGMPAEVRFKHENK